MKLDSFISSDDFRREARRRLPKPIFDFVDSGAGAEGTTRANEEAFHAIKFRPRQLVDISGRSQRTTVLGRSVEMPVLLGPAGTARLVHRDGELAAVRAASRMGTVYCLSTGASCSIEEVAEAAGGGTLWFQVYMWRSRELVESLISRAERAGYHAIILTVDTATAGRRDRDLRNGLLAQRTMRQFGNHAKLTVVPRLTIGTVVNTLMRPRWLMRHYLLAPPITFKVVSAEDVRMSATTWGGPGMIQKRMSETATWEEVRWIRRLWQGPFIIKGILTAEDAHLAFDNGADAVIVSNHGGRHQDGLPATIDVLPRVVAVAAKRGKEVFIDGGVRRGIDVVKAIALGARGCLIVRPYYWALAVDGEKGVLKLLTELKVEIDSCLGHLGRPVLDDLDPSALDFTVAPWHRSAVRGNPSGD